MSLMEDCLTRTMAAKGRVCGEAESVNINGTDYDSLVNSISATEVMLAGGTGKADGFRCQVKQSDFDQPPAKFSTAICRGVTLQVLSVDDVNGVAYDIMLGDPLIQS